jgi:RNA polymerase sigma-B factor
LNAPRRETGTDLVDALGGIDPRYADIDDRLSLQSLVSELPPRERGIVTMRFYEYMSQPQIAAKLGVSQMYVSRALRRSLAQLRVAMLD